MKKSVLLFIVFLFSMSFTYGQYTEKQLKQLDKMDIKAAIYNQEVNEPTISRILVLRRQQPKLLVPGIVFSTVSAGIFALFISTGNNDRAIAIPFIAVGSAAGGASLAFYTISLIKRSERNKLLRQLKN